MKILKFNESLSPPSYEQMVDELCRYKDYITSSSTYKDLFGLRDSHSAQRYEELLVPVNDIRHYCWYEHQAGKLTWYFSKDQMMRLKHPDTRKHIFEMYKTLQKEVNSWNDVDDLEASLISSFEGTGLKWSLELVKDMFYCFWYIEVDVKGVKDINSHLKILQTFKLIETRSKGIKEIKLRSDNIRSQYILEIKHIKVDKDGKPIIEKPF